MSLCTYNVKPQCGGVGGGGGKGNPREFDIVKNSQERDFDILNGLLG